MPERLCELYERQRLQQKKISELAGPSADVVRYSLSRARNPDSSAPCCGQLEQSISRKWLRTDCHVIGRNAPAIADKAVRQVERPPPRKGSPARASPFAEFDVELSLEKARVSRLRNYLPMLRRITTLPGMLNVPQ